MDIEKNVCERNIEIKARVGSDAEFESRMNIARELTESEAELLPQRDVFFNCDGSGRFKLRYLQPPAKAQLVYYDRPNVAGPKLSKYNLISVDEPQELERILEKSNGVLGVLAKQRYLFWHEQTRIHLDKVEQLGNFIEFEVCLRPEQSVAEGQQIADDLMKRLKIKQEDLMEGSYMEALLNSKK